MADTFLTLVSSGKGLGQTELKEVRSIIRELKKRNGNTHRMAELAVKWVIQNAAPIKLGKQPYDR
jgi:hypothetical protein